MAMMMGTNMAMMFWDEYGNDDGDEYGNDYWDEYGNAVAGVTKAVPELCNGSIGPHKKLWRTWSAPIEYLFALY